MSVRDTLACVCFSVQNRVFFGFKISQRLQVQMRSRTTLKANGNAVMRNYENRSQSNLDWLAQEEAYEDLLSPPMSLKRETQSTEALRDQVKKLSLYLKRERATVAALQDRLIYEEETNAKLRKRLEAYEKRDACPPLETTSSLIRRNRKVSSNVVQRRRSKQKRPPWNDDFAGICNDFFLL